ncbi:MAG: hypothetical protein N0C84_01400 [Candidatus Thiodiazotropha taylori]|uniref:Uncharacterized protein n=1 Tax=Candidatus Thiodiazotropha taylori TaxID=2792791 RepID=A0A9E4KA96_9GAMM|nr:hypothetical protein [Candidatus Thiodiazotropha taylori]MCW4255103.1 hypothetical protein [Candidatus Thiodiazotropha taylori]
MTNDKLTELMKTELDRVVMKGNPDKFTIQTLMGVIWELNNRINVLEGNAPAVATPAVDVPPLQVEPETKVDPAIKVNTAATTKKVAAKKPGRPRKASS